MLGQSNDIYQDIVASSARLERGMALLYQTAPIYSPLSKDPEAASEVYAVLTEDEAVRRGVKDRRLLEDALVELGFPLEELTGFDAGRRRLVHILNDADADAETTDVVDAGARAEWPAGGAQTILHALQAPLPYIRRGQWGRK